LAEIKKKKRKEGNFVSFKVPVSGGIDFVVESIKLIMEKNAEEYRKEWLKQNKKGE